jgi:hypothetical protein
MRSKCFIQQCKTVMLCNGSAFKFPTQILRRNSRCNLSLHLNYYISWCYSVRLANIIGLPFALKSSNKQLMHTFLHLVISLQNRFYTLALIFAFDLNIYSPRLRLFKSDPVTRLLPATHSTIFHFSAVFAVPLSLRYFSFKYLDRVK